MKERYLVGDAVVEAEVDVAPGRVVLTRGGEGSAYTITAQPTAA